MHCKPVEPELFPGGSALFIDYCRGFQMAMLGYQLPISSGRVFFENPLHHRQSVRSGG